MAYNNGREDRKWRIWKEAEEKVLREHGVDEATIEQIRIDDRADFNSNRRFYHWTSDFGEYLEGMLFASWRLPPLAAAFNSDTASFLEKIKRNGGFDFSKLLRKSKNDKQQF